jgi:hypothetical protein
MEIRPMQIYKLFLFFLIFAMAAATAYGQAENSQASGNLLDNASFDDVLAAGGLPKGWSYWSGKGDGEYRSEVAEGGHTGQKSLKLEGKGVRGVIFTNGIKIERNKRYALRGWVKVEGNQDAKAKIQFNYFHDRKWLGLPDSVGVGVGDGNWKLLAKTDRASEVPDASFIWISCVLEGTGTAWFDDLELVAYDNANLPEDFEKQFGPSNRPAEFQVLERRIGTWDTEQTIKPGVWVPDGSKTTGVETVEWTLDKKLIQIKHKQQPGNLEALSLVGFDTRSSVFRTWFFDSSGNLPRSEITGQWDEPTQALTFKSTDPEEVTVTSTQKFVGPARIETRSVWRAKDGTILMEIEVTATLQK